jgi:hypothetical protein
MDHVKVRACESFALFGHARWQQTNLKRTFVICQRSAVAAEFSF